MKAIKLLPLLLSILMIAPINPVKSFNHKSDKSLVINYKTNNDFSHKISYLYK